MAMFQASAANKETLTTSGAMWRAQIENEYGFCPFNDKVYLRHLVDLARKALGSDAVLFTTDPPQVTEIGSLRGEEVLTCAPRLVHGLGLNSPELQPARQGGAHVRVPPWL